MQRGSCFWIATNFIFGGRWHGPDVTDARSCALNLNLILNVSHEKGLSNKQEESSDHLQQR